MPTSNRPTHGSEHTYLQTASTQTLAKPSPALEDVLLFFFVLLESYGVFHPSARLAWNGIISQSVSELRLVGAGTKQKNHNSNGRRQTKIEMQTSHRQGWVQMPGWPS